MAEIPDWKKDLETGKLIRLTCGGEHPFSNKQGYVGTIAADRFVFEIVLNDYEHFSNISDPPITKPYTILYRDVKTISLY